MGRRGKRAQKESLHKGSGIGLITLALGALSQTACNPFDFMKCRDEMSSSQQVLLDMDDQKVEDVEKSLHSVQGAIKICKGTIGDSDLAKLTDAEAKLEKQLSGLKARAVPKERPKLSDAELALLVKSGDPGCPKGQQYEHPQNKKLIRCTGPQMVEMTWAEAVEQFNGRRGFSQHEEGNTLKFESGAQVFEFEYAAKGQKSAPQCLTIVGQPGIAWQELVARATGVQPRVMKLKKPIPARNGPIDLLVEGNAEQFVVKLGRCQPTAGQSSYEETEN